MKLTVLSFIFFTECPGPDCEKVCTSFSVAEREKLPPCSCHMGRSSLKGKVGAKTNEFLGP